MSVATEATANSAQAAQPNAPYAPGWVFYTEGGSVGHGLLMWHLAPDWWVGCDGD